MLLPLGSELGFDAHLRRGKTLIEVAVDQQYLNIFGNEKKGHGHVKQMDFKIAFNSVFIKSLCVLFIYMYSFISFLVI